MAIGNVCRLVGISDQTLPLKGMWTVAAQDDELEGQDDDRRLLRVGLYDPNRDRQS